MLSASVLCIAFALTDYARDRNLADKSGQAKKVCMCKGEGGDMCLWLCMGEVGDESQVNSPHITAHGFESARSIAPQLLILSQSLKNAYLSLSTPGGFQIRSSRPKEVGLGDICRRCRETVMSGIVSLCRRWTIKELDLACVLTGEKIVGVFTKSPKQEKHNSFCFSGVMGLRRVD